MSEAFLSIAQIGEWFVHPIVMQSMMMLGLVVALFSHAEVVSEKPAQSVSEFFAFNLQFILAAAFLGALKYGLHWAIGITQFEFLKVYLQVLLPINLMYLSINCGLVANSGLKVLVAYGDRVLLKGLRG